MLEAASPNSEHIQVWNEILVPKFTRFRKVMVDGLGGHSREALRRHPVRAGDRILDVGCGFGETTIELGVAAGPTGRAVGIDCCEPFLAVARADLARAGVAGVSFRAADAQFAQFDQAFDLCYTRYGTMYFAQPAGALANLRRATKPGGRLLMLVWRQLEDNPWMGIAKEVARRHLPPPADEAPSCGPGPFSLASEETVRGILGAAKWSEIALERIDADVTIGDTVEDAIAFQLAIGPAGEIVREARELGQAKLPEIVAELTARLTPFRTDRGVVVPSSSWCVTAQA